MQSGQVLLITDQHEITVRLHWRWLQVGWEQFTLHTYLQLTIILIKL